MDKNCEFLKNKCLLYSDTCYNIIIIKEGCLIKDYIPLQVRNVNPFFLNVFDDLKYIPNAHRQVEVIVILEGSLVISLHNDIQVLETGDMCLILDYVTHSYYTKVHSKVLVITFTKEEFHRFKIMAAKEQLTSSCLKAANDEQRKQILNIANELIHLPKGRGLEFQQFGYLAVLIGYFLNECEMKKDDNASMILADRIMAYLSENCHQPITLEKASHDIGISKYHLSHICSEQIGINFKTYVNSLRLSGAKRLLVQSDLSISEISKQCGFESIRTFNRLFAENFNITPAEFREQNRRNNYIDVNSPHIKELQPKKQNHDV